jgi:formamidopyrimidine-DNA glycosylase
MPELPEVETIRLGLQRLIGLKIKKVEIISPKSFVGDIKDAEGQLVKAVYRRAKILGIELSKVTILIHLKMSGQLIYIGENRFIGGHPTLDMRGPLPNKSTRVIFSFSDGSKLYFNDQRRFGWIRIIETQTINQILQKLGPEPLEKNFTWKILKSNLLNHKSLPIKVALLDQSVVAGIGNIYASEACFNAGIDPRTKVSNLTDAQFKSLHQGIIKALNLSIKHGGSTLQHFLDSSGKKGNFLNFAFVYNRAKEACKVCSSEIKKIQLNGRGTYYCEKCQNEK